jgi:bifunctional UDP-N-acetylglucosamine pyrophosphorylase/glucosamine-1-phosphate N-acetyltransferase
MKIAAVILAAGRGKRMNLVEDFNKVTSLLSEKPIILHIVQFMKKLPISQSVIVVGHAKESVMNALVGEDVSFAVQREQLGTGDALAVALPELAADITEVLVVYGDDAVFYNDKHLPIIGSLFEKHERSGAAITFLTITQDDPTGLGRIVRLEDGHIQAIVEEKDATDEQRKITEINPGCFLFKVESLKKYLPLVEKSPTTGEYYLTSLIDVALRHGELVETVRGGKMMWRGVNTPEELAIAEQMLEEMQ